MPSANITALTALATPQPTMLLYAALSPFGVTDDRKITADAFLSTITANISDISLQFDNGLGTATVSAAGKGKLRYNDTIKAFQFSADGAAYANFGGGGNTTAQGTFAARPAAGTAGNLYLSTDGFVLSRDTGAAYSQWGPFFNFTPVINADYTWVNQGGATVTDAGGGVILRAPTNAGNSARIRKKAVPGATYTITIGFIPTLITSTGTGFNAGFAWRQSSDGKLSTIALVYASNRWFFTVSKWDDATTFNSNYVVFPDIMLQGPMIWLRAQDDGANRIASVSFDGQNFIQIHSIANNDFLTANEVGFYTDCNATIQDGIMNMLSWQQ